MMNRLYRYKQSRSVTLKGEVDYVAATWTMIGTLDFSSRFVQNARISLE